jgi:formylglycine-generating enzyme required for sulfatase activity
MGEWADVMGTTIQQQWTMTGYSGNPTKGIGDNYPIYYVSWGKVLEYCNRRSIKEG